MDKRAKYISSTVFSALIVVFLYIVLHEFGHMIVMLSAGATITEFSISGAHVSAVGGSYTNVSKMWLHVNGAVFPLLISYLYLLLYRRSIKNTYYRVFSLFLGVIPAASLLAWVFVPLLYMSGNAPSGDDVSMFLYTFSQSFHPIIVSLVALVLIGVSVLLMIKKGVIHNFGEEVKALR
ncbi:MAG: hypothetical protein GX264_05090 [Clostridiales bacterium]|jgi:hypothetical protein|nr:hypothetical protein [Clostridiales bacterium]